MSPPIFRAIMEGPAAFSNCSADVDVECFGGVARTFHVTWIPAHPSTRNVTSQLQVWTRAEAGPSTQRSPALDINTLGRSSRFTFLATSSSIFHRHFHRLLIRHLKTNDTRLARDQAAVRGKKQGPALPHLTPLTSFIPLVCRAPGRPWLHRALPREPSLEAFFSHSSSTLWLLGD